MQRLVHFLEKTQEFNTLLTNLKAGVDQQAVYGLSGSQKAFVLAALALKLQRPFLFITHSEEQALETFHNLQALMGESVLYYPLLEWLPFEVLGKSKEVEALRLQVLAELRDGKSFSIVTTVQAVERLFPPRERWFGLCQELRIGESYDLEALYSRLVDMGYERVDLPEGPGQFSVRGGIVDIYAMVGQPVRLEFFDEELDSIRFFDPVTQRSVEHREQVVIYPARELVVPAAERLQGWPGIVGQARRVIARLKKSTPSAAEKLTTYLESLEENFKESSWSVNFEPYLNYAYKELATFFDYMNEQSFIVLDEPIRIREYLDFAYNERAEEYTQLLEAGQVFSEPNSLFMDFHSFITTVNGRQNLLLTSLPRQIPETQPKALVNFIVKPTQLFVGRWPTLADELKDLMAGGYGVAIFVGNEEKGQRLKELLWDYGINAPLLDQPLEPSHTGVLALGFTGGFQLPLAKLAVITEHEIFHREQKKRKPRKLKTQGEKITPFVDLKPGDFIVHVNHGIGKYMGVEKLDIGGVARDYFVIKYAGEDKLYVPFDQVNLIQKYLGGEGQAPKLYHLGGNDWNKVKSKVKAAVKELAFDLLQLYAEREKAVGYAFSEDTVWQKEFEERFPYQETADQLRCIEEVKRDMKSPRPMDRLICGDVGYGKTEVAIRAAFKAVMEGKQVAVLVPTTILAQQHFITFSERFAGYPITVEMLSRFRSTKEQRQVVEGLKQGSVDIVIGTHRIVSEDVKFKDLGLVIVDEEQRFGVSHKERLKLLKKNVDVITLSATPIPRTLHMALVNIRDMSVIETPPEDRYPVQTYVAEANPELIREAIRRELNRGGQVFYVHNRVQDLEKIAADLSKLVPEARIVTAHGQMGEDGLEQVMFNFMERQYDILVCTTIIETGLDLPNVNTLIVSDADKMGLSQLYQLRGRVGRSNRKAFAYFLYRRDKIISEVAEKRLSAIRDFTEFGSGFKIAMRDLELRGAGNILGAEQHGQMAAVGFDLYCRLLEQAVAELKGEEKAEAVEPSIELNVNAYIDSEYINDSAMKTEFYKRLMQVRSAEELEDITEELIDRFGDPPPVVVNLLGIVAIRIKCMNLGIGSVTQVKGAVRFKFATDPGFTGEQLLELASKVGSALSFSAGEGLEIKLKINAKEETNILKVIERLLDKIISIADKQSTLV